MSQAARRADAISARANANGFGAEVAGLDLSRPLDDLSLRTLRDLWLAHQVVWIRDQDLTVEQFERFTLQMGDWGRVDFIEPMKGHPQVLELRREPDEKAAHFGGGWHSDYSFQDCPPAATLLLSRQVPPVGGDTLFASGYAAYDALSDTMKTMLAPLKATHSAALPYAKEGIYATETEKRSLKILPSDDAKKTRLHPVIRTHPETGRKALWVNPVYTVGIDGLTPAESANLLGFLTAHCLKDAFQYRHKWEADTLLMWDNRCVQHFADAGFDGHRRVMWRTTTAGTQPV